MSFERFCLDGSQRFGDENLARQEKPLLEVEIPKLDMDSWGSLDMLFEGKRFIGVS